MELHGFIFSFAKRQTNIFLITMVNGNNFIYMSELSDHRRTALNASYLIATVYLKL